MISLVKGQVPAFLRVSAFYQAIEDDEDCFDVPTECFKEDSRVVTTEDLNRLLSIIRFWGLEHIPSEIVAFVSLHKPKDVLTAFTKFRRELKYLNFLEALCIATDASKCERDIFAFYGIGSLRKFDKQVYKAAAQICLLQYAHRDGRVWDFDTCRLAAQFGRLDVLQFLHEHGCPWNEETCEAAAASNCLSVLRYAHDHGCPWNESTCRAAVKAGHLKCLKYAAENGCPWGDQTLAVSLKRSNNCYDYLKGLRAPTSPVLCAEAAARGDLSLLKMLRAQGCAWDETTPATAARGGNLPILKYAHEHGCPWDASTCSAAAAISLECLQYVHEHGCPWDKTTMDRACMLGVNTDYFAQTPSHPSAATLRYAHQHGCPWSSELYVHIAHHKNYDALVYAHHEGLLWQSPTLNLMAQLGTVQMLEYMVDHGYPLNANALNYAFQEDNFIFLLQSGCPISRNSCAQAAILGIACLKLVHERGGAWDKHTCAAAARADKLDCLQYLRTHGCPWDIGTMRAAMEGGSLSCLKYAHENGCEWDASLVNKIPLTSKTRRCIEYVQDHPVPVVVPMPAEAVVAVRTPRGLLCVDMNTHSSMLGTTGEKNTVVEWTMVDGRQALRAQRLAAKLCQTSPPALDGQRYRNGEALPCTSNCPFGPSSHDTVAKIATQTVNIMQKSAPIQDTSDQDPNDNGNDGWTVVAKSRRSRKKRAAVV